MILTLVAAAFNKEEGRVIGIKNRAGKKTILTVDDVPDTREILKRNLSAKGYNVVSSSSVRGAERVLEERPIDLVITDLKMPGADGHHLLAVIRDRYHSTRTIMITGCPTGEESQRAFSGGVDSFLAKPFTAAELFSAVDGSIGSS